MLGDHVHVLDDSTVTLRIDGKYATDFPPVVSCDYLNSITLLYLFHDRSLL